VKANNINFAWAFGRDDQNCNIPVPGPYTFVERNAVSIMIYYFFFVYGYVFTFVLCSHFQRQTFPPNLLLMNLLALEYSPIPSPGRFQNSVSGDALGFSLTAYLLGHFVWYLHAHWLYPFVFTHTLFTSVYRSSASGPISRPQPLCL